jgi:phosphoesterase RecJ-like protein
MTQTTDMAAVTEVLRSHDRFLVTSHENPDGDAVGSLLAMHLALVELGKDSIMVLAGTAPLPAEYGFLELNNRGLLREAPRDRRDRVLVAVDCAQETRLTDDCLLEAPVVVNVDHHHDNTRFGTANLVAADASSTAEVLADVLTELGVGLAAVLLEAGADLQRVFQGVYESMQFAKVKLLARALDRAVLYEGGRVVVSYLLRGDFGEVGAAEPYSEGIIDVLRAVEGAELAALIREPPRDAASARKISLRSSSDRVDVSAIARKSNGGGHRQAAGFSSDLSIEEITAFIVSEFAAIPATHA